MLRFRTGRTGWYSKFCQKLNGVDRYYASYSGSYCLDVLKVAAVSLEADWLLVEEPLKSHVQRCVMCRPAAQHHALPHGDLHSARTELHTHGLCKHKAAALSPQANPAITSDGCIPLGRHCQTMRTRQNKHTNLLLFTSNSASVSVLPGSSVSL